MKNEKNTESEKIVEDTIKYATKEVKRIKNNYLLKTLSTIIVLIFFVSLYFCIFKYEKPIKYNEKMLEIEIPEDGGIDIKINLENYSVAKAVLVKVDEEYYDLYLNVRTTFSKKIFKNNDFSNNVLRVGNGMIVDFQSGKLMGNIPNGQDSSVIKNIYYINNLSNKIATLDDESLINYEDKVLIWERD